MAFITVTAGHSNTDPGAVYGSEREAVIAAELRNMVAFYISRAGIECKTDGKGLENQPLKTACTLCSGAAVAVEIHLNAALSKDAGGVECLAAAKDKELAQNLCTAVAGVMNTQTRGEKGWKPENAGQHSRLAYVQAGGLVLEVFFITNDSERAIYYAKKWMIARVIAETLIKYFQKKSIC